MPRRDLGVISLDKLGLEKVYIQAKRYAEDNAVDRPTIQAFLGALAGRRASKGVFLTTSRFSRVAREFAASASDSLVLIDGGAHRISLFARHEHDGSSLVDASPPNLAALHSSSQASCASARRASFRAPRSSAADSGCSRYACV